jgi:hypothetical protein
MFAWLKLKTGGSRSTRRGQWGNRRADRCEFVLMPKKDRQLALDARSVIFHTTGGH